MFAYCNNKPVNLSDNSGALPGYAFWGDNHVFSDNILRGGNGGGGIRDFYIPTSKQASEEVINQELLYIENGGYDEAVDTVQDVAAGYKFVSGLYKVTKGIGMTLLPDPTWITDIQSAGEIVNGLRLITMAIIEWTD